MKHHPLTSIFFDQYLYVTISTLLHHVGELTAIEARYRKLDERVGELESENNGLKDSLENAKKEVSFKSNQITSRDDLIIRHNEDVSKYTQKVIISAPPL